MSSSQSQPISDACGTTSDAAPSAPWRCAGCGAETTDLIRNCDCPTGCLIRRVNGRTEGTVKFGHAAHARWPRLTPLAARLADALETFVTYGCPACNGDCAAANPPVLDCPMQAACSALAEAAS